MDFKVKHCESDRMVDFKVKHSKIDRLVDFKQNIQYKKRQTFNDDEKYQLYLNEANCIRLKAEIRLVSSCSPLVSTLQHGKTQQE